MMKQASRVTILRQIWDSESTRKKESTRVDLIREYHRKYQLTTFLLSSCWYDLIIFHNINLQNDRFPIEGLQMPLSCYWFQVRSFQVLTSIYLLLASTLSRFECPHTDSLFTFCPEGISPSLIQEANFLHFFAWLDSSLISGLDLKRLQYFEYLIFFSNHLICFWSQVNFLFWCFSCDQDEIEVFIFQVDYPQHFYFWVIWGNYRLFMKTSS